MAGTKFLRGTQSEKRLEEIKERMGRTRADMKKTLNAIQRKIPSSGKLSGMALERTRNMAISAGENIERAGSSIFNTIKKNPIPSALAGIGLVLFLSRRRSREESWGEEFEGEGYGGPYLEKESASAEEEISGAESRRSIFKKAGDLAGDIWDRSVELGEDSLESIRNATAGLREKIKAHLWTSGLVVLGIGFALGAALQKRNK